MNVTTAAVMSQYQYCHHCLLLVLSMLIILPCLLPESTAGTAVSSAAASVGVLFPVKQEAAALCVYVCKRQCEVKVSPLTHTFSVLTFYRFLQHIRVQTGSVCFFTAL